MKLLALDTSSDACSVALQVGDEMYADHVVKPRQHTALLIPMINGLLQKGGIALAGLDALVLGNGPGSFIGMRIGSSVAQGICFGSELQIVPVSSLAAVAAEAMINHGATDVVVAQDARMNEVYLCLYRANTDGLPAAVTDEVLHPVAQIELPELESGGAYAGAGLAWQRYPELLTLNEGRVTPLADVTMPNARFLPGLGARAIRENRAVDPADLVPAYIRTKVADSSPRQD